MGSANDLDGDSRRTGKVGVYDRPAGADRSRLTPTLVAIGVAVVVGIPLLIWAL